MGRLKELLFFPGGKGTFNSRGIISDKPYMIIGQDFDSKENYKLSVMRGEENIYKIPTWRHLLKLLCASEIDRDLCFFTNAFLGARVKGKNIGKSPGFKDSNFVTACQNFFLEQLNIQKPKVIFVLGLKPAIFLSDTSDQLQCWKHITTFSKLDESNKQIIKKVKFKNGIVSDVLVLTHPCMRKGNVKSRKYKQYHGEEAEIQMIKKLKYYK